MGKFIVRRKSSAKVNEHPSADALSRLSAPAFMHSASVSTDGAEFAPFSEIQEGPDISQKLSDRRTLVINSDKGVMQRLRSEAAQQYHVEGVIEYTKTEIPFDLFRAAPLDLTAMLGTEPLDLNNAGADRTITVRVQGRGGRAYEVIPHAEVHAFLSARGNVRERVQARTNQSGVATFFVARFYRVLAIVAYPYSEFGPAVLRGDLGSNVRVLCDRLPQNAQRRTAWWHEAVGSDQDKHGSTNGRSIMVGVIDSGCGPNPALRHVRDLGAFIDGTHEAKAGEDSGSHGTHVCGIIGARTNSTVVPFRGIASGSDLMSARVFSQDAGANQGDIADALDEMVNEGVELVNMSLGSLKKSDILAEAIDAAYDGGTVCVCAAGNNSGPVSHPAAHSKTIAVSAIGKLGEVEAGSLPALPNNPTLYGARGYYAADFTCFGKEVCMTAPGVGIVSTVPERFGMSETFAMMSGTSMASPIVTGSIAAILAGRQDYLKMSPRRERSKYVRNVAAVASKSIELPSEFEGWGLPQI